MITKLLQIVAFQVSDINGLDPINVYLEDLSNCAGRITVSCFGEAWTAYFASMGCVSKDDSVTCRTTREFVKMCDDNYLVSKLMRARRQGKVEENYLTKIVAAVRANV